MQIATGEYIGNDASDRRIVTGMSGRIRHLDLSPIPDGVNWVGMGRCVKTDFYPADAMLTVSLASAPGEPFPPGAGVSFDGADFIVKPATVGELNLGAVVYRWTAFSE